MSDYCSWIGEHYSGMTMVDCTNRAEKGTNRCKLHRNAITPSQKIDELEDQLGETNKVLNKWVKHARKLEKENKKLLKKLESKPKEVKKIVIDKYPYHRPDCDGTRQREGGPDGPCLCDSHVYPERFNPDGTPITYAQAYYQSLEKKSRKK